MRVSFPALAVLAMVSACTSLSEPDAPGDGPGSPADLPAASVSGRVLSKELGVMSGVHVLASPAERSTVTGGDGQWRIDGLIPGPITIRLGGLPPECTDPGARDADLNPGAVVRVRFLVDCSGTEADGSVK